MVDTINEEKLRQNIKQIKSGDELNYYFNNCYCNIPFFMNSLTENNSMTYTYFGDMQTNLFYISDNMKNDFGFPSNLVINLFDEWRNFIYSEKWKRYYDEDKKRLFNSKSSIHDLYYQVIDRYDNVFWIRCCGELLWNKDNTKPLFFAGRVTKQSINFTVDPITNFPTSNTLVGILKEKKNKKESFWTIGFSLNNFSKINSIHGHRFADRLISDIAKNLSYQLSDIMTFFRLPGIRAIAIADKEINKDEVVQKIQEIVENQYKWFGILVDNPCSVVPMIFPKEEWSSEEFIENMVSLIKLAQFENKSFYKENIEKQILRLHETSNMHMVITKNVMNYMKNFRIMIQPIVDTKSNKIISGEVLLRWSYKGSDISPSFFIPILEKDRLIQIAGRWIFEEAVQVCSEIIKIKPDFHLNINLSLQQLYDNDLYSLIDTVLDKNNLDGIHIVIEMTESTMDKEPLKLMQFIAICKKRGIQIALDDFGTGYSSLRVLMKYPIDIIKIDRSLLLEMIDSDAKSTFFTSLINAGQHFGKKVCVEGVETENQKELVEKSNVDMIQGFFYYRPLELHEFYKTITKEVGKNNPKI